MRMAAPVPFALEHVLDAVVEAFVQELTEARRETALARAGTGRLRHDLGGRIQELERQLGERDAELEGARREGREGAEAVRQLERSIAELEGTVRELTKSPKMGSGPAKREAISRPEQPSNEGEKSEPAPAYRDPRGHAEDLTGARLGSYVCQGRAERRSADGAIVWCFRCELCNRRKDYSLHLYRLCRKRGVTCPCTKVTGKPARGRVVDRKGLFLGLFTCEGSNGIETGPDRRWVFRCGTCKARLDLKPDKVSGHVSAGTAPRCTTCEPERRGRKPAATAHEAEPREEPPSDLDFSELDSIDGGRGGDDLDELLERSMRDADGDGRLRSLAALGGRPRERDDEEGDEDDEDEADDDQEGETE